MTKLIKRNKTFKVNEITVTIMSEKHTSQSELLQRKHVQPSPGNTYGRVPSGFVFDSD